MYTSAYYTIVGIQVHQRASSRTRIHRDSVACMATGGLSMAMLLASGDPDVRRAALRAHTLRLHALHIAGSTRSTHATLMPYARSMSGRLAVGCGVPVS